MRLSRRRFDPTPWLAALVFAAVLAAFSPALLNGFVVWDDDIYLTRNPVFHGPALAAARWSLSTALYGHYMPLVWLSFAADYALHGLSPGWFHLTNVLLHAAASVLVFLLLRDLFERAAGDAAGELGALGAAAAALFWALHPLRVESVAWAAERKDVLCGALWTAALLAYVRGRSRLSLGLFAASLAAKVSGIMLPFVLVVLDIYPLGRLPAEPRRWGERALLGIWLEKAAFLAVALLWLMVSLLSLRAYGLMYSYRRIGGAWRLGHSLFSLWFYPVKTAWPGPLSALYEPRPWFGRLWPEAALLAAATAAAGAAGWSLRRRAPAIAAAVAAYVILVLPALGAVENGQLSAACCRYSYLPSLPLAALFGAAVVAAARRRGLPALAAAAAVCALAGGAAYSEAAVWRDTETLWARALAVEPGSGVALMNLGVARAASGRYLDAVSLFQGAARAGVTLPELQEDLGGALAKLGRTDEAMSAFRRALAVQPTLVQSRRALSVLLAERAAVSAGKGNVPRALRDYKAALSVDGGNGAAHNNLGLILESMGRRVEARRQYQRALSDPAARAVARYNWGNSLLASGDDARAETQFALALRLDPGLARAEVNRGNILARRGRLDQAAAAYRRALKKDPGLAEARVNLDAVERLLRR